MASTSDIRKGLCIRFNNDIFKIIEFLHVKPGKGPAFVRTKLKSVTSGKVIDNFKNDVKEIREDSEKTRNLIKEMHEKSVQTNILLQQFVDQMKTRDEDHRIEKRELERKLEEKSRLLEEALIAVKKSESQRESDMRDIKSILSPGKCMHVYAYIAEK